MVLCRAPAPSVDDQSSAASPSPAIASQRRVFEIEMCIVLSSPNAIETTGPAPHFKLKNDSKANGILLLSFRVPRPVMLSRRRPHANWLREVDWRTEIRGHEPVRARHDHRFRPGVE